MTLFVRFKKSSESIRFEVPSIDFSGNAFLPSTAMVSLLQHSGCQAKPVVSIGERVREGQLIARGTTSESANVHSPIPGIVREFRTIAMPDGTMQESAVILLSGAFDLLGRREEHYPWQNVPESEILRVLEDKGTVNTFEKPVPLAPMLREAKKKENASLAIRFFDSDPTCRLDSWLVSERLDMVLEGSALVARALDAKKIFLVHSGKKWTGPDEKKLKDLFQGRTVSTVRSSGRYPSGNEGQIRALLGNQADCPDAKNPVLIDPVTAMAAYEAVVTNNPGLNRYVVVSGPALEHPTILKVKVGTTIGDVIEECGGFKVDPARIVVNGLLLGHAVYDLDTPITKYTKSLHVMDRESCPPYKVRNCIHCGRCLQVCPVGIDPHRIAASIRSEKTTPKLLVSVSACQYCGCCAIVCPSRIPLHHIIGEASLRLGGTPE
jgi:electron transport complex protein RnfC